MGINYPTWWEVTGGATTVTKPLPFSIIFHIQGVPESYTEGRIDLDTRNQDPRLSFLLSSVLRTLIAVKQASSERSGDHLVLLGNISRLKGEFVLCTLYPQIHYSDTFNQTDQTQGSRLQSLLYTEYVLTQPDLTGTILESSQKLR